MKRLSIIAVLLFATDSEAQWRHGPNCTPSRQAMLMYIASPYQREAIVKQTLLQYAIDAPTENLRRELKNRDPFVRWAAAVEINRRWSIEQAIIKADKKRFGKTTEKPLPPLKLLKGVSKYE